MLRIVFSFVCLFVVVGGGGGGFVVVVVCFVVVVFIFFIFWGVCFSFLLILIPFLPIGRVIFLHFRCASCYVLAVFDRHASRRIQSVEELENTRSLGGERHRKRKRWKIYLERTRRGYHQSDKHWN